MQNNKLMYVVIALLVVLIIMVAVLFQDAAQRNNQEFKETQDRINKNRETFENCSKAVSCDYDNVIDGQIICSYCEDDFDIECTKKTYCPYDE